MANASSILPAFGPPPRHDRRNGLAKVAKPVRQAVLVPDEVIDRDGTESPGFMTEQTIHMYGFAKPHGKLLFSNRRSMFVL